MISETKICQNCNQNFTIEPADFDFYTKINVPPPTFCPECRLVRRLARRNERSFHKQICGKCKKEIISVFAPDSGITVYCSPCWWSDDWDAMDYGVDFDPNKSFLVQLNELFHRVPMPNVFALYTTLVNSDYTNMVGFLKNCYMVTYSDVGENIVYGSFVNHSKDSVDNLMIENCELCYECVNCKKCYRAFFSADCEGCNNIYFSKGCVGCNDCFGCVNLRNQKYHVFNEPYSKEEYEKKLKEILPKSFTAQAEAKRAAQDFWNKFPQKYMHGWRNTGSTGDYLNDTKNAKSCFIWLDIEDSRYCAFVTGKLTDSYDFTNFGFSSSLLYETLQAGNQVSKIKMSWLAVNGSQDIEYSMWSVGSKNLFGSVGLKKKDYCILNKKYSKEEYETLREKIIDQMNNLPYVDKKGIVYKYGEFLPPEMSPFGYNESTAQEFFPLTNVKDPFL